MAARAAGTPRRHLERSPAGSDSGVLSTPARRSRSRQVSREVQGRGVALLGILREAPLDDPATRGRRLGDGKVHSVLLVPTIGGVWRRFPAEIWTTSVW